MSNSQEQPQDSPPALPAPPAPPQDGWSRAMPSKGGPTPAERNRAENNGEVWRPQPSPRDPGPAAAQPGVSPRWRRVCQIATLLPIIGWGGLVAKIFGEEIWDRYYPNYALLIIEIPLVLIIPLLAYGVYSRWTPLRMMAVGGSFLAQVLSGLVWTVIWLESRQWGSRNQAFTLAPYFVLIDLVCVFFTLWLARLEAQRLLMGAAQAVVPNASAWAGSPSAGGGLGGDAPAVEKKGAGADKEMTAVRRGTYRFFTLLPVLGTGGTLIVSVVVSMSYRNFNSIALVLLVTSMVVTGLVSYGIFSRYLWLRLFSAGANALMGVGVAVCVGLTTWIFYDAFYRGRAWWRVGLTPTLWETLGFVGLALLSLLGLVCTRMALALIPADVTLFRRRLRTRKAAPRPHEEEDLHVAAGAWDEAKPAREKKPE